MNIEFQWLSDFSSLKEALQEVLGSSGQLLKKHFSSKELSRPIRSKDVSRLPLDLVNHMRINPEYEGPDASILLETPDYLVLHKPSGIHSHPLCYSDKDTLINYLASIRRWDALSVNKDSYDRGLIFRLDNETSGLMLVAKTNEFFEEMRIHFKDKMKNKFYWAIVDGEFDQEGEWTHYFRGTGAKGSKQKVDDNPHREADAGTLEVRKVLSLNDKTLVLVNLKSGLRHQIRAQLSYLGFPILGDELYGGKKAERVFLHALRYEWNEVVEDPQADLFDGFFDLNRALQMSHDMLGIFKRR